MHLCRKVSDYQSMINNTDTCNSPLDIAKNLQREYLEQTAGSDVASDIKQSVISQVLQNLNIEGATVTSYLNQLNALAFNREVGDLWIKILEKCQHKAIVQNCRYSKRNLLPLRSTLEKKRSNVQLRRKR